MKPSNRTDVRRAPARTIFAATVDKARQLRKSLCSAYHHSVLFHVTAVTLLLICLLIWQKPLTRILMQDGISLYLISGAAVFALIALIHYCRVIFITNKRVKESEALPFSDAMGISYLVHISLGLCLLAVIAFNPPKDRDVSQSIVYEFLLQPQKEPHNEHSRYFSIDAAKDHGTRDRTKDVNETHSMTGGNSNSRRFQQSLKTVLPAEPKQYMTLRSSFLMQPKDKEQQQNKSQSQKLLRSKQQEKRQHVTAPHQDAGKLKTSVTDKNDSNNTGSKIAPRTKNTMNKPSLRPRTKRTMVHMNSRTRSSSPSRRQTSLSKRSKQAGTNGAAAKAFNPKHSVDKKPGSYKSRSDVNFGPYMLQLQRVIKRNWSLPRSQRKGLVRVAFKIGPSGQMFGLRLTRSSGIKWYDQSALQAVRAAAPFMPLPAGRSTPVDVDFDFNY